MDNCKDLKEIIEKQAALNQKLAATALELDMAKERLAAYKDLGPLDHLRELAQAEKDGRLAALIGGEE